MKEKREGHYTEKHPMYVEKAEFCRLKFFFLSFI